MNRQFNAGRKISAANEKKLKSARDDIDEVLSQLEDLPTDGMNSFNRSALAPGNIRIAKKDAKEAEVYIYGDIGGWWDGVSAENFAKEIAALDVDTLTVHLNSVGGMVFDGIAIYNALAGHKANVVMNISGIAASIASVIAMAGDEIRITEGSNVMIHKPWSFAIGDAESMRKEASILDKLEKGIIDIYEARTGADRKQLETWVAEETWFLGKEAVDAGFADILIPAKKKEKNARSNLLDLFKNAPENLTQEKGHPAIRDFETILREGEGFSHSVAKRVAAAAAKIMTGAIPSEGDTRTPPVEDQSGWVDALRRNIANMRQ